jgi:hypothetical protein
MYNITSNVKDTILINFYSFLNKMLINNKIPICCVHYQIISKGTEEHNEYTEC